MPLQGKSKTYFSCFLLAILIAIPCAAQLETVFYPEHLSGGQFPQFGFGYSLSLAIDRHSIALFNAKGEKLYSTIPTLPDRSSLQIFRGAVSPSGMVALVATAEGPGGTKTSVLLYLDQQGKVTHVTKCDDFGFQQLKFTSDAKLWALGLGQTALRIYTAQGKLEKEALPTLELPRQQISVAGGLLTPTPSGLAVYLPGPNTLYQFSADGAPAKTYPNLPLPEQADVLNFVASSDTRFVLDAHVPTTPAAKRFENRLFLLSLDTNSPTLSWLSNIPKEAGSLLGTHMNHLLLFHARLVTKIPVTLNEPVM